MSRAREVAVALGLAVLCAVAFSTGLTSPLTHYDDMYYLALHEAVQTPGWEGLKAIWDSSLAWGGEFFEFSPLRDTVYWAVIQLLGFNQIPLHLASLAFHVLATLLAWRLARRVGLGEWGAAFAAAVFAVHPIHIESVVWVAGLKDPMYTAFMLASLLAYDVYRERGGAGWYTLALLGLEAALLSKSMAVVTPVLMVALERWVRTPTPWPEIARRVAGPALIAGLGLLQATLIAKATGVLTSPHGGSWTSHAVLALWAQALYLGHAIVPTNLRFIYCFTPPTSLLDWRAAAGLGALAALGAAAWWMRARPLRLLGLAWYVVCLLPVSNLIPFTMVFQERFLYASGLGLILIFADVVEGLHPRLRRLVAGATVLALATVTVTRSALWQDEFLLWDEPDSDPECIADRSHFAAQVHILAFWTASEPDRKLEALARLYQHPGFEKRPRDEYCGVLAEGLHWAVIQHQVQRFDGIRLLLATQCPDRASAWRAIAAAELHRRPRWAARAADLAYRLEPGPLSGVLRGLAHLEAGELQGQLWALEEVTRAPAQACPLVRQFKGEVKGKLEAELAPLLAHCATAAPEN